MTENKRYTVFYLVGGSSNFVCKKVFGRFDFDDAGKNVNDLKRMGYKSMSVKDGHIIGGYCSYNEFSSQEEASNYFNSI